MDLQSAFCMDGWARSPLLGSQIDPVCKVHLRVQATSTLPVPHILFWVVNCRSLEAHVISLSGCVYVFKF